MSSAVSQPVEGSVSKAQLRWTLLGLLLGLLLTMLDNAIVGTAMPAIVHDLGGADLLSWVVTGYLLASAVTAPLWGKTGDAFGHRTAFLAGVVVFLAGSAMTGASWSMPVLILGRVVQGAGAGGIAVSALSLIGAMVTPRERGRYQGLISSVVVVGTVAGPLVGGVVTQGLGWRWDFYINLPLGGLVIAWIASRLRQRTERTGKQIDLAGIAAVSVLTSAVVLALSWAGSAFAWLSWQVLGLFTLAAITLVVLIIVERRASDPLIPPRVLTGSRNVSLAAIMAAAGSAGMLGATLYLPIFQQSVQRASPAQSGLMMMPMMIAGAVAAPIAGTIMSATGRYKIFPTLGASLAMAGFALLATVTTRAPVWFTSGVLILVGIGMGCLMQMTTVIAQNSVHVRDVGSTTSLMTLGRTLGGAAGVAVFGSIFTGMAGHAGASTTPTTAHATATIALIASGICGVALIAALVIKEVPLTMGTTPERDVQ